MLSCTDVEIINEINSYSLENEEYWSFRGRSKRQHCHDLIQYPAMMVPEMQGELIDAVLKHDTNIKRVLDPFVGSGTTLGEAMYRGLDFFGIDINPLSVLACEVKSGPLYVKKLEEKSLGILESIKKDRLERVEIDFDGVNKWFLYKAQLELSVIYRAIKKEPSKWARKIFWLSMSDTVRTVCNSRNSTYKLHIKSSKEISSIPSAINVFEKKLMRNVINMQGLKRVLKEKNAIKASFPLSNIVIENADSAGAIGLVPQSDILVSSPPYGDNSTTVTYGQFSYLPLMWIDTDDIDSLTEKKLLSYKSAIDSVSLGGSLKFTEEKFSNIKGKSLSLVNSVEKIKLVNDANIKKLISFVYDLELSLSNCLNILRKDAYMIWTLGNRRISNIEIPLDKIMREILESKGCSFVHKLERKIPSKRMAVRNKTAVTMGKESVLIMRNSK